MRKYIIPAIILFFIILLFSLRTQIPFWLALIYLSCFVFIVFAYLRNNKQIKASGILSLLLTLSFFCLTEIFLESLPAGYIPEAARKAPLLVPQDRGNIVYQRNGFRGKRPCKLCPENLIRIVTMGGSSTFGIPMYYSQDTYSARLQSLLNTRRVGENYEVLNGGIAGYGIMQIVDSLEQEVLQFKPDIVTICAWFNDSSPLPSWYGYADKSDLESYQTIKVLSAVQKIPGFKAIYNSKAYAFSRYYFLSLLANFSTQEADKGVKKRGRTKPRMNPKEFEWGLEQVVKLAEKHDFLPVFIFEPLNRTPAYKDVVRGKRYYDILKKIAEKYELPLVDTLETYSKRRDQWLFYDFIHPNQSGHRLTAETIYDTLFTKELPAKAVDFLKNRGINLEQPDVRKQFNAQYATSSLVNNEIRLKVSTPLSSDDKKLSIYFNSEKAFDLPGLNNQEKEFIFAVPEKYLKVPILDLKAKVQAASIQDKSPVGQTGTNSPSFIYAKSGGKDSGWVQAIRVDGVDYAANFDGYSVVVLGASSGKVRNFKRFNISEDVDQNRELYNFLSDLSHYFEDDLAPIVIITLKTDGFANADEELLSNAFKSIGGSGETPRLNESFILIGVAGAAQGKATELMGYDLLEYEIGSRSMVNHKLLQVTEVF